MQRNIAKKKNKKNSSGTFLKIIMLGDSGVGKTTLVNRYVTESYSDSFAPTIGVDFQIKRIEIEGQKFNLQIWDTAGQQKFKTLTKAYFQGCHGVILVFSLTDKTSFKGISRWINQLHEITSVSIPKILIAGKSDDCQNQVISMEELAEVSLSLDIQCVQVSAKTGYNVSSAFETITEKIIRKVNINNLPSRFQQESQQEYNSKSVKLGMSEGLGSQYKSCQC